ncbi:MAG: RNA polymerase sigma factor, partial [Deltaproteobacteria bacterium]|nr:RNA polymerase sigma factor [Deltaproteobacteria bacterium]
SSASCIVLLAEEHGGYKMKNRLQPDELIQLVHSAKNGNRDAFEKLARTHLRSCIGIAYAILGNMNDAEDVAQDSLILAMSKINTLSDPQYFSGWIIKITRNQSLNLLKKRKHHVLNDEVIKSDENNYEKISARNDLREAFKQITPLQRQVILLHEHEGWTHPEISKILEISVEACRWQLFHARNILKEHFNITSGPQKEATNA